MVTTLASFGRLSGIIYATIVLNCLSWCQTGAAGDVPGPTMALATDDVCHFVDAENGNDSYSGRLPEPSPNRLDGPLRTIQVGYDALRRGGCLYIKKGMYRETVTLYREASESSPVVIRAFPGDEGKVIITGAERILNWTPCASAASCAGNPNWKSIFYADVQFEVTQLFQDTSRLKPSRYPNQGWLYPTSVDTSAPTMAFFDSGLRKQDAYFAGATCNVMTQLWQIDQIRVHTYSGQNGKITLESPTRYAISLSFGYYFTQVIGEINDEGEWAYDGAQKRIYFWPMGKSLENIEATARANGIRSDVYCSYHTVEGLTVTRAIDAIHLYMARHMTIKGNTIEYSYDSGIVDANGSYTSITDNTIRYCNHVGITDNNLSSYDLIQGNTVYATGAENVGDDLTNCVPNGIFIGGSHARLINNRVDRCGYTGILLSGNTSGREIAYNYVTRCCLSLADGSGIYAGGPSGSGEDDTFHHNIIDDVGGWLGGSAQSQALCAKSPEFCRGEAHGIYLDEQGDHKVFEYNTVINCGAAGVFFHWTQDNRLAHNTLYDNAQFQMLFSGKDDPRFILRNNTTKDNLLIATKPNQKTLQLNLDYSDLNFGDCDGNRFYHPGGQKHITVCQDLGGGPCTTYSLAEWREVSGKDVNSKDLSPLEGQEGSLGSPVLFANPSMSRKAIDLAGQEYLDVDGNDVKGSVTLGPFESLVLFPWAAATGRTPQP